MRQNDSDIHKEPLKTDGSSINTGLERSYSSPNLLQVRTIPRLLSLTSPVFFCSIYLQWQTYNYPRTFLNNSISWGIVKHLR